MELYMKQKVFSWGDKFTVTDASGEVLYYVEGEMFTLGHKLHIFNARHEEVAFLHQKLLSLKARFFVTVDGEEVAEVEREITLLHPKYVVKGPDWEVKGDVLGHDYTITKDGGTVATMHWKWMAWGDSYVIDVADPANEVLALATVLAIDAVNFDINSSESAAQSASTPNT